MAWFNRQKKSRRGTKSEEAAMPPMHTQNGQEAERWSEESEDDLLTSNPALFPPRLSLQSRSLQVVQAAPEKTLPIPHGDSLMVTHPVVGPQICKEQRRLAGRSTKVHLQAIRPEQLREPETGKIPAVTTSAGHEAHEGEHLPPCEAELSTLAQVRVPHTRLGEPLLRSGQGEVKEGQAKVMVVDPSISEHSVVTIMLAGDPGPVVVQYVLLHPQSGFTFHLSAPACLSTPFNYSVWTC